MIRPIDGASFWEQPLSPYAPHPIPSDAPPNLEIRAEAPQPLLAGDAALGTSLGTGRGMVDGSDRPHRLVVLGDSISQGFQSFAIHKTELSWPKMVADAFGFDFRVPVFNEPQDFPGLPFNLEAIAWEVHRALGDRPFTFDEPAGVQAIVRALETIRSYWTSPLSRPPVQHGFNENLAVWGFDVRDALSKSRAECNAIIDARVGLRQRIDPRRHFFASHANELTTLRTLLNDDDPSQAVTQVSAAQAMAAEHGGEGIDTLVVALGANNALKVVADLEIKWSGDGFQDLDKKGDYNLWTPDHFKIELDALVTEVLKIGAAHTLWLTVPHVTVVPILRGVGEKPYYSRYYSRYTHAWISDEEFDGNKTAALSGDDARMIDAAIDQYNWSIKRHVHEQREKGNDWLLVDLCGLLDRLAYQRYLASPASRPTWWSKVPTEAALLPPEVIALSPRPDTRFFLADKKGRTQGGLIALDGVHPTTIGYGLIAQFVADVMVGSAAITHAATGGAATLNWPTIVENDTLVSSPPPQLTEIGELIGPINEKIDAVQTFFGVRPS